MKKINVIICAVLLMFNAHNPVLANDQYVAAMQKCISELYNGADIAQLRRTVNTLERISATETDKWEPKYYIAFGYIMMATREGEGSQKDTYLDQALEFINKAKVLKPSESEIIALEGFVHMIRVTVDAASRGQQFAPLAMQAFGKALSLNSENPRALALSAQMQYGTAQFFGNSTAEACGMVRKSLEKFESEEPKGPLAPAWGRAMAESLLAQCK